MRVALCAFGSDRRLSTRLIRRLNSSAYFRPAEADVVTRVRALAAEIEPDFVFLNQANLAVFAASLRRVLPERTRIVVLSHGLESTDLLHTARMSHLPLTVRLRPTAAFALGSALLRESRIRAHVDVVCALSPFDAELERWVGARRVGWLPRTIRPDFLDWRPSGDRIGFLGTLDHAPNLDGLVQTLDQLHRRPTRGVRVRIVGGPVPIGRWLARSFPQVDYLGPLGDEDLAREAASWNAMMHPIFCVPRGCSTKLATAIAWGIPVVTTSSGSRGYLWRSGALVTVDEPARFAEQCLGLLDSSAARAAREAILDVARTSPTLEENASRMRSLLGCS